MSRKTRSRVTIASVARAAGVSIATAGRVLGEYGYASEDVKTRVQSAADRLGYRPNMLARSLITGRTQTIGVVVGDIQSPYYATVLRGIEDVAREAGFGILVTNTDEQAEREIEAVRLLSEKQVDGLCLAPSKLNDAAHLTSLVASGCPVVQFDRVVSGLEADSVTVDNRAAARASTQMLIDAGHRRIAIVAELEKWNGGELPDFLRAAGQKQLQPGSLFPSWQRLLGYLEAFHAHRLSPDLTMIVRVGTYSAPAAIAAVGDALDSVAPPTAIFATDGLMSSAVMAALNARRLRVRDDVSLIGFDDLNWMSFHCPPISAVLQPVAEIGRRAASLMLERLSGGTMPPRHEVLMPELILRESIRRL